jgi:O-antigen/teichoic acid export membrane protein
MRKNRINQKSKNFIWNSIGTSFNAFISLILLIIVTRFNGIESAGIFSFVYSFSIIMFTISNYGGRIYQTSDLNNEFSIKEYFNSRLITSILMIFISLLYCLFSNYNLFNILLVFIFVIVRIIETLSDIIYGELQKNERLDIVGKSLIYKNTVVILAFLLTTIVSRNLIFSVMSIMIVTLLIFLFYDLPKVKKFGILLSKAEFSLLSKSKYIFLFGIVTIVILNVPRFIANIYLNSVQIGYIGILMMIPSVIALLVQLIVQPKIVLFARLINDKNKKQLYKESRKCILLLIGVCILCSIAAIFLGNTVLSILYGVSFESYELIFCLLILIGTLNGITSLLSSILSILREIKIQFYMFLSILIFSIVLSYFVTSEYLLIGLIVAFLISMCIQLLMFSVVFYIKTNSILSSNHISDNKGGL